MKHSLPIPSSTLYPKTQNPRKQPLPSLQFVQSRSPQPPPSHSNKYSPSDVTTSPGDYITRTRVNFAHDSTEKKDHQYSHVLGVQFSTKSSSCTSLLHILFFASSILNCESELPFLSTEMERDASWALGAQRKSSAW